MVEGGEVTELKFNTEGKTDCPMKKGKATREECLDCIYRKMSHDGYIESCIYKDIFTVREGD